MARTVCTVCFSALFVGRVIGTDLRGKNVPELPGFSALFVGRVIGTSVAQRNRKGCCNGFSALFVGRVIGTKPE